MSDKIAYTIVGTERSEDGQYIPCIVKEGETGYCKTTWLWGKSRAAAEIMADQQNAKMGVSKEEAMHLVLQSFPKASDIHAQLDGLREKDSEAVLEWIREHVRPHFDGILDWTLEWD